MPRLDPLESCSHGAKNKKTWRFSEPRWFYRLRRRVFGFAGETTCSGGPAFWHRGPDGFRTCSCCGSLNFDDFMEICRRTLTDERYRVDGSTKSYKVYVTQPGVRNASEGAIKFYTYHAPEQVGDENDRIYAEAVKLSSQRYEKLLKEMRHNAKY